MSCKKYSSCVALAFYHGLSHAEVAEHLAQPLGTVKSWVRRFRAPARGADHAAQPLGTVKSWVRRALMALKNCLGRPLPRSQVGMRFAKPLT